MMMYFCDFRLVLEAPPEALSAPWKHPSLVITVVAIISPAAGLRAKSIISPGRTDTEIYFQSGQKSIFSPAGLIHPD